MKKICKGFISHAVSVLGEFWLLRRQYSQRSTLEFDDCFGLGWKTAVACKFYCLAVPSRAFRVTLNRLHTSLSSPRDIATSCSLLGPFNVPILSLGPTLTPHLYHILTPGPNHLRKRSNKPSFLTTSHKPRSSLPVLNLPLDLSTTSVSHPLVASLYRKEPLGAPPRASVPSPAHLEPLEPPPLLPIATYKPQPSPPASTQPNPNACPRPPPPRLRGPRHAEPERRRAVFCGRFASFLQDCERPRAEWREWRWRRRR